MTCRLEQEDDSRTRVYKSQRQCGGNYLKRRICIDLDVGYDPCCLVIEWNGKSVFSEAFAYDIGANPFRASHVKCLKSLFRTTDFSL